MLSKKSILVLMIWSSDRIPFLFGALSESGLRPTGRSRFPLLPQMASLTPKALFRQYRPIRDIRPGRRSIQYSPAVTTELGYAPMSVHGKLPDPGSCAPRPGRAIL